MDVRVLLLVMVISSPSRRSRLCLSSANTSEKLYVSVLVLRYFLRVRSVYWLAGVSLYVAELVT